LPPQSLTKNLQLQQLTLWVIKFSWFTQHFYRHSSVPT